jgi:hypothetical protein
VSVGTGLTRKPETPEGPRSMPLVIITVREELFPETYCWALEECVTQAALGCRLVGRAVDAKVTRLPPAERSGRAAWRTRWQFQNQSYSRIASAIARARRSREWASVIRAASTGLVKKPHSTRIAGNRFFRKTR